MKIIMGLLCLATVSGVAFTRFWRDTFADRPDFRTAPVMRGDLFIGVTSTGTVEPVQIIDVGARIVGSVKSFGPDPDAADKPIDFRSRVEQGGVLAQLDDLPHKNELERAKMNLLLAEAELTHTTARAKLTERSFKRALQLRGTNSDAEYEKAEAEFEMSRSEVKMGEAKVEQARIARQQAEINLGYTTITSPVDGIVIDRRVNVGQTVVAGMNAPSLFLLAKDLSHLLVWAAVNEADIGSIHIGQPVTFSVDAYRDRTFTGTVSQIRLNASLQQNVVTYGVIVDVENPDGKLLPYMTAKLQFEVNRRKDVILVPNQALRFRPTWLQISPLARLELTPPQADDAGAKLTASDGEPKVDLGSPTVWVMAGDGLVRPVMVAVGLSDGMATEVTSAGLTVDDMVVTSVLAQAEPDFVSSFVSQVTGGEK